MKKIGKKYVWVLYITAMLLLIIYSDKAIEYAFEGVQLCIQSVIPSLFPFILISGSLTGALSEINVPSIKPLNKLLGIPRGGELFIVLGFLGGYPVGAKNVIDAHRSGLLKTDTAKRMLSFCNNAGPAFIFGIVSSQFQRPAVGWYLWGILILSSLICGALLPGKPVMGSIPNRQQRQKTPNMLTNAVKAMGSICGWVVIFRVFLGLVEQWLPDQLPNEPNVLFTGLLELTNGCMRLKSIPNEFDRFAVSAVLLSFGGICVTMQTLTVAGDLKMDGYLPGKVLQCCISYILCLAFQPILFPAPLQIQYLTFGILALFIAAIILYSLRYRKESSRFPEKSIVYCQHRT